MASPFFLRRRVRDWHGAYRAAIWLALVVGSWACVAGVLYAGWLALGWLP